MIASSFKSVGWVAGVGAAALGCYMLSLQVAAERADLSRVEQRIVRTKQAIRSLQTELGTRGRLQQLEQWNADVLALSAPVAGQFIENEIVLASLETRSTELADGAPVRLASAVTGPEAPAAAQPMARQAAAATPSAAASVAPAALVRRASLDTTSVAPSAERARGEARPAPARAAVAVRTPVPVHTAPAPVRAASLLDPGTARELGEAARAERAAPRERRPQRPEARTEARERPAGTRN